MSGLWVRRGVPLRVRSDERTYSLGLNDLDETEPRGLLGVHHGGDVEVHAIEPGAVVPVGSARYRVTEIVPGVRGSVRLTEES